MVYLQPPRTIVSCITMSSLMESEIDQFTKIPITPISLADSGYDSSSSRTLLIRRRQYNDSGTRDRLPSLACCADLPFCLDFGDFRVRPASHAISSKYDGSSDEPGVVWGVATLPRLKARSKTTAFRRRPSLNAFESTSSTRSTGSLRSPDRFLPCRRPTLESAVQSFRANKDPHVLSTGEKLLRNKDASPDAFNPRRRVTSPIPRPNTSLTRRNFSGNRSGGGGMINRYPIIQNRSLIYVQERASSPFSVTLRRELVSGK